MVQSVFSVFTPKITRTIIVIFQANSITDPVSTVTSGVSAISRIAGLRIRIWDLDTSAFARVTPCLLNQWMQNLPSSQ